MSHLYDKNGNPFGVVEAQFVFGLDGYPLAYVEGTHVYRLAGDYVGELYRDMIVVQYQSGPGSIGRIADPGRIPRIDSPGNRGPVDYGYPDASPRLFEGT